MVQEKENTYLKAFVELNEIINNMEENIKNKIPEKTRKAIEISGDKNYKFKYDNKVSLAKQNLLPETKALLSIIYSDYLCSEEEKKKWDQYDKFELNKQEEIKSKKYNTENSFEKSKIAEEKTTESDSDMQLQTTNKNNISLWSKIKNFIKKFLKNK